MPTRNTFLEFFRILVIRFGYDVFISSWRQFIGTGGVKICVHENMAGEYLMFKGHPTVTFDFLKIICLLIVCTIILDVILTPVSMVEPALCDCPVGDGGSRNSRYKGCGKENFAS